MILVFLDFETRSKLDTKEVGTSKYSKHESTLPLMLAYGKRGDYRQWILDLDLWRRGFDPVCPPDLVGFIEDPKYEFHAHNAAFEIYIWQNICVARWGWPSIPMDRWHCTAAKGCAANMPRALDNLCKRIKVTDGKDKRGKELIKKLSVPQKALKTKMMVLLGKDGKPVKEKRNGRMCNVKVPNPRSEAYLEENGVELFSGKDPKAKYYFCEDPKLMREFADYNKQDIVAEENCDRRLPTLTSEEREVWLLDRKINMRGIPVDTALCRGALEVYDREVELCHERMASVTTGPDGEPEVTRCSQNKRICDWLNKRVNFGDSLGKEIVDEWLQRKDLDPTVEEVLHLRQIAGGTATKKYQAALNFAEADGRCRDQVLYYGAATGRWTGKGIQPHNFAQAKTPDESFLRAITTGDHELVKSLAELSGTTVFKLLKSCVRGIIKAPAGYKLIVSDFAGIESRVLNWMAGNEYKLDLFRNNEDTYIHAALPVYGCRFEDITIWSDEKQKFLIHPDHEEKRKVGKIQELALGYGMGGTPKPDGSPSTFQAHAARAGLTIDDVESIRIVNTWRETNYQVVDLWHELERACKNAVKQKRKDKPTIFHVAGGKLKVGWKKTVDGKGDPAGYLCIRLPSGRVLYYYKARIDQHTGSIYYLDGGKLGRPENGSYIDTYGGKLVENVIQAASRDLLVHSMKIIDNAGLDLIFHVHDESVTLVEDDNRDAYGICHTAMETLPDWATGLPLKAETEEGMRYTK